MRVAARYAGIMYRYGGTTPAGFDCSGYTSYVMRRVGVSLPRTSGAQRAAARRVSRGAAVPGDLVFMPGHVGIYAGNGMMWDAPRTGKAISKRKIWTSSATFGRVG
jgi:cell wall-associated NlpC family hydrolase